MTQTTPTVNRHSEPLLALAAHGLKGALRQQRDEPLADNEWMTFFKDVHIQRLTGLLANAIECGALQVTERQRQQAISAHVASMTQVLMLENFLLEWVNRFASEGIRTRVLKGSAVAHLDYADPSLRPFVDVDLLVESDLFDQATSTLQAMGHERYFTEIRPGYDRRFSKGVSFVSSEGLELDLHRTFAMGPYGLTVDLDDLWSIKEDFTLAGTTLSTLGREERLLHACYHAALGDYPPRLLPHRDVAEMLLYGEPDERRLLDLTHRWHGEAVVARAVSTAWELFDIADVTATSEWASRFHVPQRDRHRLSVYTDGDTSYAAKSLASLAALPRWRDRLALARMMAAPDQSFLSRRDRSRTDWLVQGFKRAAGRQAGRI